MIFFLGYKSLIIIGNTGNHWSYNGVYNNIRFPIRSTRQGRCPNLKADLDMAGSPFVKWGLQSSDATYRQAKMVDGVARRNGGWTCARDCRKCPKERGWGGLWGLLWGWSQGKRKLDGAFKTNPSGHHPYSCAFINQMWVKWKATQRHDSCALREKSHFTSPL